MWLAELDPDCVERIAKECKRTSGAKYRHVDESLLIGKVEIAVEKNCKVQPKDTCCSKAYLQYVANLKAIDLLRSKKREQLARAKWLDYKATPPDDDEVQRQKAFNEAVAEMIKELTPRQKQIIELSYFEGISNKDIAKMLDIAQSTVTTVRQRALNSLRQIASSRGLK